MKMDKRIEVIKTVNNAGDKIKITIEVKEKGGNVTFINISKKIEDCLRSFTDIPKLNIEIKVRSQSGENKK